MVDAARGSREGAAHHGAHASRSALDDGRPWRRATAWLAGLCVFFYASYSFSNWLASLRAGVPVVVYDWEHAIPFVAWMIIPYWSTNLLFAVSLFFCRSRTELDSHAKRLLTAQVVAISCFILFPLRTSFPVPELDGIFGLFFAALGGALVRRLVAARRGIRADDVPASLRRYSNRASAGIGLHMDMAAERRQPASPLATDGRSAAAENRRSLRSRGRDDSAAGSRSGQRISVVDMARGGPWRRVTRLSGARLSGFRQDR